MVVIGECGKGSRKARRTRPATLLGLSLLCGSALAGCLDHELAPGESSGGASGSGASVFIATQREFARFEDWMPFETEVSGEHAGMLGTITEYLNQLPPSGATQFPVGTMIAKTVETDAGVAPAIHAMVKRGGTFNAEGALGWEYFELQKNERGTPVILWRGTKPPNGERYKNLLNPDADMPEADCNDCHARSDNDAVLSDALKLSELP